jgi:hypothetical protein
MLTKQVYIVRTRSNSIGSRVEAGYSTSTVALRVVGGDKKGNPVYLGHPIPERYKYGDQALKIGGISRIGTIKYGLECCGTPPLRHCNGEDQQQK